MEQSQSQEGSLSLNLISKITRNEVLYFYFKYMYMRICLCYCLRVHVDITTAAVKRRLPERRDNNGIKKMSALFEIVHQKKALESKIA